jgi:membrane protein YqaA with SNARE-associated domain
MAESDAPQPQVDAVAATRRPHLIRRLYDWVLNWAETPYGVWALFILAFAESSFFPIPPDVLLIALAFSIPARAFRYALISAIGSVLGGLAGYGIGFGLWEAAHGLFIPHVFSQAAFDSVVGYYAKYDFWIVFTAAFTPIPYKVITITAGVCRINLPMFIIASAVGRAARFFLVAWLIHHFGKPIRTFIEKYFNLVTVLFTVGLIGGFVLLRYWEQIRGLFE